MSIEEKAKDFSEYNKPHSQDVITTAIINDKYNHFKSGAEWMLGKALEWLTKNAQNYYEDAAMHDNCWYNDEQMIEDFKKAMKE